MFAKSQYIKLPPFQFHSVIKNGKCGYETEINWSSNNRINIIEAYTKTGICPQLVHGQCAHWRGMVWLFISDCFALYAFITVHHYLRSFPMNQNPLDKPTKAKRGRCVQYSELFKNVHRFIGNDQWMLPRQHQITLDIAFPSVSIKRRWIDTSKSELLLGINIGSQSDFVLASLIFDQFRSSEFSPFGFTSSCRWPVPLSCRYKLISPFDGS